MTTLQKTLLALAITLSIFALVLKQAPGFGSVSQSSEYMATTTDATWNTVANTVYTGTGTLGSVIVTLTSNAPIAFYDATTTGPHSDHATTSLMIFKTTTAGTYVCDCVVTRGLVVDTGSTVGKASTTITFRPR